MREITLKDLIKRAIKTLTITALVGISIALSSTTFAVGQGFYIGIATGPATNTSGNQPITLANCTTGGGQCGPCNGPGCAGIPYDGFTTIPGKPTTNQWGSRFFLGYMFNPYYGIEGGFNFFSGIHYNFPQQTNPLIQPCGDARVRVRDIDISGKFALPAPCFGFDAYGKVGIALTYQTVSGALNQPQNVTTNCNPCNSCTGVGITTCGSSSCPCNSINTSTQCGASSYITKYSPIFTIGASYELTQSIIADVSWTTLLTGGPAKSVNFLAVGISYHMVDVYCGQFLCD